MNTARNIALAATGAILFVAQRATAVNLDTLSAGGLAHAHAFPGGAGPWDRVFATVPNAVGGAVGQNVHVNDVCVDGSTVDSYGGGFAGRTAANRYMMTVRARVIIAPTWTVHCEDLHGLAIGYADPAPDPCASFEDALAFLNEAGPIEDGEPIDDETFQGLLDAQGLDAGHPGSDSDVTVIIELDEDADLVTFTFDDGSSLSADRTGLSNYSLGLCITSEALGVHRTFSTDEDGLLHFSGGWTEEGLGVSEDGARLEISSLGDALSFAVEVSSDYTADDFGAADFVMTSILDAGAGAPSCPEDIDRDGFVDFPDILAVLSAWGGICESCPEDLDGDGMVSFGDLLVILGAWGPCP